MKTQRTTRYVWCIALVMALLCGNLQAQQAGPSFFDDFSDGDPADGSPVNWLGVGDQEHSGYTLTPEGLKLGSATAADRDGTPYIYRDVSVRVQIKRTSNHTDGEWESGLVCRWNEGGPGGYWIEVRPPNRLWLGHRNRYILRRATLPFNVDEKELIIRVDMIGDQIECWCWPADEPMPDEPQITLVEHVVPDGMFALYAGTGGGQAVYRWAEAVSTEAPSVDFNGDGMVNIKDLLKMIGYWGQNEPSVDFVPDGTVDDKDLEVLMGYWQQDVKDLTLMAHWALDEVEGSIAQDSVSLTPGTVLGGAIWRPEAGQVEGALEFDGVDDVIVTGRARDPSGGPFSVLAWVKGGAPGQVIFSQMNGADWLMASTPEGALTTGLGTGGRAGQPLASAAVITDGAWHRVACVWDGKNRTLYVDDLEVAQDVPTGPAPSDGGLQIGAGSTLAPGTFWTGLIDDVRIYNRAVKP